MKSQTDFEIIESVVKGNQSDFAVIVDRYKNKAFPLLVRMLKDQMEAEEVLQDCFLKAYNALHSFKFESKFSTWFYRIVYNTALTRLSIKKRKIISEMSSIDDHLNIESDYDFNVSEKKDLSEFIGKVIEKLPEKYSAVINMFYINNMSCEEISEVMSISVSNVKVLLYRARIAMKDLIEKKYSGDIL